MSQHPVAGDAEAVYGTIANQKAANRSNQKAGRGEQVLRPPRRGMFERFD